MIHAIKAVLNKGLWAMEIVLHLGAHRCATTTFQTYLDQNRALLARQRVAVWTPQNTRAGLFEGLIGPPGHRPSPQIGTVRDAALNLDADQLIVSEENMLGSPRNNLKTKQLYPIMGPRLAQFEQAFSGHVKRIGLAMRSYESYWISAMSFAAMRGHPLPGRAQCAALAAQSRTWAQMAQKIRILFPGVPLHVWAFEAFAGRPRRQFTMLSGRHDIAHLLDQTPAWKNTSRSAVQLRRRLRRDGRFNDAAKLPKAGQPWQPFTPREQQHMATQYADDLTYLRSGSDPLIHFTENATIKVLRRQTPQASPAFDTGVYHDRQATMG